jgi:Metallo-peptidase family M12B Reprolysin-like/FG-GAP-like repeat/Reprolysin family propeptide
MLNKFSSIVLSSFVFFVLISSVSAQSKLVSNDIKKSFKAVEVKRFDTKQLRNLANQSGKVRVGKFDLSLTPRDLRSRRFRAEETNEFGIKILERAGVTTYKGKIADEARSEVRLTIDDTKIEGFIFSANEKYFIEPAKKHSQIASNSDFVIYREGDLIKGEDISCPMSIGDKLEAGTEFVSSRIESPTVVAKVLKIATEADFQYVSDFGGSAQANADILETLNMVEGVYENELGITIDVVFQHTWATSDPYPSSNANDVLQSFKAFWNTNYPTSQVPRDLAHIWTAKPNASSQGIAFFQVICSSPQSSYGLTGKLDLVPTKFILTAHEIGHNLGANHADGGQSCADTTMNAILSNITPFTFCGYSRNEVTNYISSNGSCLSQRNLDPATSDFDGDGKTDISVFRSSVGEWYFLKSGNGVVNGAQFGASNDKPVPADFTGDGKTDIAFYRQSTGTWFVLRSEDSSFYAFPFGNPTDIPTPGDFDGDGKFDAAVFRASTGIWYINKSSGGVTIQPFGTNGDRPVVADYDGDGKTDIAIFRPSVGEWYALKSGGGITGSRFGSSMDKTVQGDYTGDGKADFAFYRPSTGMWFVLRSEDSSFFASPFGASTDTPTAGDFDGDGKFDQAVFRPSTGIWYINKSNGSGVTIQPFGSLADMPVPSYYLP